MNDWRAWKRGKKRSARTREGIVSAVSKEGVVDLIKLMPRRKKTTLKRASLTKRGREPSLSYICRSVGSKQNHPPPAPSIPAEGKRKFFTWRLSYIRERREAWSRCQPKIRIFQVRPLFGRGKRKKGDGGAAPSYGGRGRPVVLARDKGQKGEANPEWTERHRCRVSVFARGEEKRTIPPPTPSMGGNLR